MLPSSEHEANLKELADLSEGAERKFQEEWQQCQSDASKAASADRVDYYNCDQLGTPRELANEAGFVIWAARTGAWGRILASNSLNAAGATASAVAQPIRFQGQYEDSETNLFYNRYRYYDPDCGRYISQDSVGILGGLNAYAYSPSATNWVDILRLAKSCAKHPKCDPCDGRNPAAEAISWQGPANAPYLGVDSNKNVVISKGTIIYTLYPHGPNPGNYFVTGATVLTTGEAREFNDSVQVAHSENSKHRGARPMRTKLHAYVVEKDTCVAEGVAKMNPLFGKGGSTQYFLQNRDKVNINDTGRIISFKK